MAGATADEVPRGSPYCASPQTVVEGYAKQRLAARCHDGHIMPNRLGRYAQRLGLFNGRNLYWWWPGFYNFGDWFGPAIFEWRTGQKAVLCTQTKPGLYTVFYTAGSVLARIPRQDKAVVWGSGLMDADQSVVRPKEIRAVRGPLTRERCLDLGYRCPDVYGDPGILAPMIYAHVRPFAERRLGIVPHFQNYEEARRLYAGRDDVIVIDVTRDIAEVVSLIATCRVLASSSLHGLIVAHAFEIPCLWVSFDRPIGGGTWKFADYWSSGGLDPNQRPARIDSTAVEDLEARARRAPMVEVHRMAERLLATCPF